MYLLNIAKQMLANGHGIEAVRTELRSTTTDSGDSPTCSYVETVISAAVRQREHRRVKRRRYRDNRKIKRAATMTVEPVTMDTGNWSDESTWDESTWTDATRLQHAGLPYPEVYKVTGERIHFVTVNPPAFADCDCKNSLSPCSHVIAVTKYLTVGTKESK